MPLGVFPRRIACAKADIAVDRLQPVEGRGSGSSMRCMGGRGDCCTDTPPCLPVSDTPPGVCHAGGWLTLERGWPNGRWSLPWQTRRRPRRHG